MNVKDRRIHIFLQLFFLLIGIFQLIRLFGFLQSNTFAGSLFEFQQNELPFLSITASVIASFTALISAFSMWTRTAWTYGFTLFTSGLLFMYHLLSLGKAIQQNSYEIIPIVIVLIVLLQSFPFLLRKSYRTA
ncbi:MAG: hypothetical protein CL666_00275 [Balneola sp.]|nr:hypothetical protein [Balneola sp.]|tara:strand:- start:39372 stop:39770 length:399 start_codon:yes stop_codon:yes gene_type:complete